MFRAKMYMICLVCAVTAYNLKFDYQIREGQARFIENIETNLGKNTVKISIPAHNKILESHKMQDFRMGKQITCFPSLNQCRVRDIDSKIAPDAGNITESFVHSWNHGINSISSDNSTVITELYYLDGNEILNTASFGDDLIRFYKKFEYPLYQERKVPSDAEIVDFTAMDDHRNKRAAEFISPDDCDGQMPKPVFAIVPGKGCNYYRICEQDGNDLDCGAKHILTPTLFKCWCCPGFQTLVHKDKCACQEV